MKSDRELADAVEDGGDETAFRALYRRHTPRLYRILLHAVGESADAEDAVQETWIRAVAGVRSFRWESAFGTWLIGIGLNVVREIQRRERPHRSLSDSEAAAASPSTDLRVDLETAIRSLPAGQRTVLVLHDVEGWTHEEIARQLGITPGTSKSQLFDARRRLRAMVDNDPNEEVFV